jgi:palmitoyltransferase
MGVGVTFVVSISAYAAFLVAFFYFCVFADPDESPTALFLTETLPHKSYALAQKVLGRRTLSVAEFFADRVLLVAYCVIVFGCWSIIFSYCYPWVDRQDYLPKYHKLIGYTVFLACLTTWRYASKTSPGIITAKSLKRFDHYPYDGFLFVPDQICKTRKIPRLARSKFDRFRYHENVARFDHFCGWVYNTIGEENYRFFLLFLLVHVGMCIYGSYTVGSLFYGEILDKGLLDAVFFDRYSGEEYKADKWIIFQYLFHTHFAEAGVLAVMVAMSIALGLFLLYHCWLTSRGMTTNESYKWGQVHTWYKRELRRYNQAIKNGEISLVTDEKKNQPVVTDSDITCTPVPGRTETQESSEVSQQEEEDAIVHPGPEPKNIYDRGFVENWKEVIFPLSLRKDDAARPGFSCNEKRKTP